MSRMLIVIITLLSSTAHADGPREVVERYDSAITSQNWERALEQVRPMDVANLRAEVMKSLSRPYSEVGQLCFGTASTEDIAKMSDVAVAACLFKATLSRRGISVENHTMTILGSVTEDTNTVHFVVKSQMRVTVMTAVSTVKVEVVTAVREGGVWHVKLPETATVRPQAETRSPPPVAPPPPPPPPQP